MTSEAEDEAAVQEEFIDESNPFYAAKKAQQAAGQADRARQAGLQGHQRRGQRHPPPADGTPPRDEGRREPATQSRPEFDRGSPPIGVTATGLDAIFSDDSRGGPTHRVRSRPDRIRASRIARDLEDEGDLLA